MAEVGRYWYNGGSGHTQDGELSVGSAAVGSYLANAWGLYDMHGNVWEWCLDWYVADLGVDPVVDPVGGDTGSHRVVRGGGWGYTARQCRSANRYPDPPSYIDLVIGFRVSLAPPVQ
jgi:formylglycine-generating enzyme required for sulfatase activity